MRSDQLHATKRGVVRLAESRITARLPSVKYGSPVRLRRGECAIARAHPVDVASRFNAAGLQQVLDDVIAGFIDVGIDAVRGQVPGSRRESHADIAADLANPRPVARGSTAA